MASEAPSAKKRPMNRLQVALMFAALLPRPAAAEAPLSVDPLTSERQETVCALQLNPETAAYKIWGGGSQRRAFADELLPACFERTLAIEELITDQPVRWVFTGPRAGVTVFIGTNEVRLAHRFYDSPGFFEVAGKSAGHPEWRARERAFAVTGRVPGAAPVRHAALARRPRGQRSHPGRFQRGPAGRQPQPKSTGQSCQFARRRSAMRCPGCFRGVWVKCHLTARLKGSATDFWRSIAVKVIKPPPTLVDDGIKPIIGGKEKPVSHGGYIKPRRGIP